MSNLQFFVGTGGAFEFDAEGNVTGIDKTDAVGFMRDGFWQTAAIADTVALVFLPTAYFFHVLVGISVTRFARQLRSNLYQHIQGLSTDFFQRNRVGEIATRLSGDLDGVIRTITMVMPLLWVSVMMIQAIVFMFYIRPVLFSSFAPSRIWTPIESIPRRRIEPAA